MLKVVAVCLNLGGFKVNREVALKCLIVGIEVNVFVLPVATFKRT
jgi:hypothetical protein